jgi:hypothetical protein
MQDHPSRGVRDGAPSVGHGEHSVERWLLLELVTTPPPEGDDLGQLAVALRQSRPDVETAARALVEAGLAECDGETLRASAAALRFEALWPIRV